MPHEIDLGHEHYLTFSRWAPDDLPANRERYGVPLPCVEKFGATVRHLTPTGEPCLGAITFDGKWARRLAKMANQDRRARGLPQRPVEKGLWVVVSWEPLTLSPSLLCACGDHGHVKSGKWVPCQGSVPNTQFRN